MKIKCVKFCEETSMSKFNVAHRENALIKEVVTIKERLFFPCADTIGMVS